MKSNGDDDDCAKKPAADSNDRSDDDDDADQSTHSPASNNALRRRSGAPRANDGSNAAGAGRRTSGYASDTKSSKRLIESPASAADTTSTCSLSTAASPGMAGGFGSAGDAAVAGGGIAVGGGGGALVAAGTGPSGRQLPARKLTRQERRLLRRQRRQGRQRQTPEAVMRQLQTLASTLGISFGLFLLFFLNLPALLFLISTLALAALTATIAYQYVLLQYNAVLETGGFVNLLPESVQNSIRDALQGTTLHEWMTDPAFFMEYRYLMLYFIPGLDQSQLDALVDRLPERHRNVLRQPGYMSSMTPASVRRALVNDESGNNASANALVPAGNNDTAARDGARRQLFAESQSDSSSRNGDSISSSENSVDAYQPSTSQLWADIAATVTGVLQGSAGGQGQLAAIQEEGENDDVSSRSDSVESGVVIEQIPSEDESDEQHPAIPPTVTVDDTSVASPEPVQQQQRLITAPLTPQPTQTAEEEQQVEGDILNDAVAAMTNNYINAATEAATNTIRDATVGAVEYLTPGIVRLGFGTSFLSGLGLFGGYYMNFVRGHPMGWRRPVPRLIGGSGTSSGGNDGREAMTTTARYITYGLMSSAFGGAASAGFMLLIRSGVRRSLATQRESNDDAEKNGKSE